MKNKILGLAALVVSLGACDGRPVRQLPVDGGFETDAYVMQADSYLPQQEKITSTLSDSVNQSSVEVDCENKTYKISADLTFQAYAGGIKGTSFSINEEKSPVLGLGDSYKTGNGNLTLRITKAPKKWDGTVTADIFCNLGTFNKVRATLDESGDKDSASITRNCNGNDYTIQAVDIKFSDVHEGNTNTFLVKGEQTEQTPGLQVGETYTTSDKNATLKVTNSVNQDYAGGVNTATIDLECE